MKLLILAVTVLIGGCSCCGSDAVQYVQSDSTVTVIDRYIPIPEILVDGATAELTDEDLGWTFSDVFTDSSTGKKIEVSGVIPKPKKYRGAPAKYDTTDWIFVPHYTPDSSDSMRIMFTFRVPKDSVRVQDSSKVVTLKQIPNEPSWFEKKANEIFYFVFALVLLGFVVKYNWLNK